MFRALCTNEVAANRDPHASNVSVPVRVRRLKGSGSGVPKHATSRLLRLPHLEQRLLSTTSARSVQISVPASVVSQTQTNSVASNQLCNELETKYSWSNLKRRLVWVQMFVSQNSIILISHGMIVGILLQNRGRRRIDANHHS